MTQQPRRRLRGTPKAAQRGEAPEKLTQHAIEHLADVTRVDEIVQRYTTRGSTVDLAEAFPEPPAPPAHHVLIDNAMRNPDGHASYQRASPVEAEALALEGAYRREHELRVMHRMLLRGASMQQVSNALDKKLGYVYALRRELERRLANEGANIDVKVHSANTMAFYNEVRNKALRAADGERIDDVGKARYLSVALAAENSKHKFLQAAGFYSNAPLRPQETEADDGGDMEVLATALKAMMDPAAYEDAAMEVIKGGDDDNYTGKDPDSEIRVLS